MFFVLIIFSPLFAKRDPYPFQFEGLFKEIFQVKDENYNLIGHYDLIKEIVSPNDIILEAGGFNGKDTVRLAQIVPEGKVISFEPNPSRYAELVSKTKHLPNVHAYPFALGEKNGSAIFYVCHGAQNDPIYEGASSLLPPSESMKINYQGPRIEVSCYVLDDWCRENNENKIDFMWLDLEGYELQVLKNASRILNTVKAIYVENNFYEFRKGMTQYGELRKFLEKNGFQLLSHGYFRGCQGNAIFVRNNLFNEIVQKIASSNP